MSTLNKLGQLFSQKALRSLGAGVAVGSIMLGLGAFAKPASAVVIGGIELTDDGFADQFIAISGGVDSPSLDVTQVLLDENVGTYAYSTTPGASVTLGFSNSVINGSGFDLALFELDEYVDPFEVTINGITKIYQTVFTGTTDNDTLFPINAAKINLDDFSILTGQSISQITIGFGPNTGETTLALVGTISRSVPEPSAMVGLLATAGLLACQLKLKSFKKA